MRVGLWLLLVHKEGEAVLEVEWEAVRQREGLGEWEAAPEVLAEGLGEVEALPLTVAQPEAVPGLLLGVAGEEGELLPERLLRGL